MSEIKAHAQAVADLRERLKAAYGEQVDEATLLDAIEGETEFKEIVRRIVLAINETDADVERLRSLEKLYGERRKRIAIRAERLRAILIDAMQEARLPRMPLAEGTVSMRQNAPSAIITDEAAVPPSFWKIPAPEIDRPAIAAALKSGVDVPGATLSNGSVSLVIRSN